MFNFEVLANDSETQARVGRITTSRGVINTPVFMPVGSKGVVKTLTPEELKTCGAEIVLANTYHLLLRPGFEIVKELGGLHRFMHWEGPVLTDSGGYQVYSLAALRRVEDDAVIFRSHLDGDLHRFTPEQSLATQADLGSDIAMVLDECPARPAGRETLERAVARPSRWAARAREAWRGPGALFGIVQGGTDPALREQSARDIVALGFDGYAIGGVSVGEDRAEGRRVTA